MHSIATYNFERIQRQLRPRFGFTFKVISVKNQVIFSHSKNSDFGDKLGIAAALILVNYRDKYVGECAVIIEKNTIKSRDLIFSSNFNNVRMKNRKIRRFESELKAHVSMNECKDKLTKF